MPGQIQDSRRDRPDSVGFVYLNPKHRQASLDELNRCVRDGRMVEVKLWVAQRCNSAMLDPIGERARELGAPLILLNALRTVRAAALGKPIAAGEVYVEIAALECVGGVEGLLAHVPLQRVLFGSHAPLFYFESALLKPFAFLPADWRGLRGWNPFSIFVRPGFSSERVCRVACPRRRA